MLCKYALLPPQRSVQQPFQEESHNCLPSPSHIEYDYLGQEQLLDSSSQSNSS